MVVKKESHLRYLRVGIIIIDSPGNINRKMKFLDRAFIDAAIEQEINGFVIAEYDDAGGLQRKYSQGNIKEFGEPPEQIEVKEHREMIT